MFWLSNIILNSGQSKLHTPDLFLSKLPSMYILRANSYRLNASKLWMSLAVTRFFSIDFLASSVSVLAASFFLTMSSWFNTSYVEGFFLRGRSLKDEEKITGKRFASFSKDIKLLLICSVFWVIAVVCNLVINLCFKIGCFFKNWVLKIFELLFFRVFVCWKLFSRIKCCWWPKVGFLDCWRIANW